MTHILKLALCLLLSLGFFSGVQAQTPATIDSTTKMMKNNNKWSNTTLADTFPRADRQTALMHEQLNLSPNQRTRLFDIHMRYADQSHLMLDSLGRANNLAASREKMTMLRNQQDAEIKTVLTPEQWNNWEKYQAEQNNRMNSTNPNDPANTMQNNNKWSNTTMTDRFPQADQQTAMMADQLKLSPSQKTRINDIHMRYANQYNGMLDSLSRSKTPAASREKMTMLRKQQDAEIKNVLTIDQWNTWEKYQTEQNKKMNGANPNDPTRPNKQKEDKTNMNNPSSPKPSQTSPPGGNQ